MSSSLPQIAEQFSIPTNTTAENTLELVPFTSPEIQIMGNTNCELKIIIEEQRQRIAQLEATVYDLRSELDDIKKTKVKNLQQQVKRQSLSLDKKKAAVEVFKSEEKRRKTDWSLPDPSRPGDDVLLEIVKRRHLPKNHPYSDVLKEFAFNLNFISPKACSFTRKIFGFALPERSNFSKWTKHINAKPGLLEPALADVRTRCAQEKKYYGLAFDEMAIRHQIIYDGEKMVGLADYGGLSAAPPPDFAKSALFCYATEVDGSKSFPIAYILTSKLGTQTLADFMSACISAVKNAGGIPMTVSCDGLRTNIAALSLLGANFKVDTDEFSPIIYNTCGEDQRTEHFVMPDASHMVKLARNTLDACKTLYNADGKVNLIDRLLN